MNHPEEPETLLIEGQYDTRPEAVAASKQLSCGTYSLLSVLRENFYVRPSQRVVQNVVDWGTTSKPRPRKAKAHKATKPNGKEIHNVEA